MYAFWPLYYKKRMARRIFRRFYNNLTIEGGKMSKRVFYIIITLIVGLMFVFGDAFVLCAQETESDEFTLEEITVTAQKRAENSQKVAIAMDVISGDQLADMGKSNIDEILGNMSTVMINNSPDGMRVSVRGLTETEAPFHDMHTSTPTVAINIDGAYNSSSSAGMNMFDIERVEVLYGPQSTMYSSNSPGGIVNVVTAAPKTDRYSANASAELGSFSLINFQFAGNAPIVKDKLALRLAAQVYKRDSYYEGEDQTGEDTKSARLKALWQASDKFNTIVTVNYVERINGGMMGGQVQPFDYQDGHWYSQAVSDGPWTKDGKVTNPWTAAITGGGAPPGGGPGGPPGAPEGPNSADQITKGITAEINWDTGIGSLSVVPQYSKTTSDDQGSYEDGGYTWMSFTKMRSYQEGVEARMTSAPDFFFKWILGVNYYKTEGSRDSTYNQPTATATHIENSNDVKAVFGNVTYPFTDKFRGNGGYRYSMDKIVNIEQPPMVGDGTSGQEYSSPDYKLGVEYDLAANSMLYATYATSYRVNGMVVNQGSKTAPPEKLQSYTVGAKNRFLENTLQLNADAYYYDYSNKRAEISNDGRIGADQVVYEDDLVDPYGNPIEATGNSTPGEHVQITGPNGSDPWLAQFGSFRTIGLDVSADWMFTGKDTVSFGVSYLDAKWTELMMEFYWHNASDGSAFWPTDGEDYSGRTNTYSATWTLTSSYQHDFTLGTFGSLVPQVDIQYKSEYVMDFRELNYPMSIQEPYYLVNGSVTLNHSSGTWSVNAYVKNATNYAVKTYWMNMAGTYNLGLNEPRTYGAVLSVKF
jgi:iron complex outermembrane recepter protein